MSVGSLEIGQSYSPPVPPDDPPPVEGGHKVLTCQFEGCGIEFSHVGRGRKPKYCPEHRKVSGKRTLAEKTPVNDRIARQAAEVLGNVNGLIGTGLYAFGFRQTAKAIARENDFFKDQAYEGLLTDPALCKMILSSGAKSGKLALAFAYVMFGTRIAPDAMDEYREWRESREEEAA